MTTAQALTEEQKLNVTFWPARVRAMRFKTPVRLVWLRLERYMLKLADQA